MEELVRFMRLDSGPSQVLPLWEALLTLCLTLLCSLVIALVYRKTHSTVGYSSSYVHSLVLTSLVTSLIMIVIGSNIARAFSLVGALSIIRFRNAIKETRDVGFVFFSMAIAMAAGTRFYALALIATAFICLVMILLHAFKFCDRLEEPERLLSVRVPATDDPLVLLEDVFSKLFTSYSLVLLETAKQGLFTEATFSVKRSPDVSAAKVLSAISAVNSNLKVKYHVGSDAEAP